MQYRIPEGPSKEEEARIKTAIKDCNEAVNVVMTIMDGVYEDIVAQYPEDSQGKDYAFKHPEFVGQLTLAAVQVYLANKKGK